MILFTAVALVVIAAFVLLVHHPRFVPHIALSAIVILAAMIPRFGPSDEHLVVLTAGSAAIGVIAVLRRAPGEAGQYVALNRLLVAYLVYSSAIAIVFLTPSAAALRAVTTVALILVVVLARRTSVASTDYFPVLLACLVLAEVAFGVSEAFLGADAVWPRPDGSDRLEGRVNHIAPWLAGRVLGTFAGPIPYGTVAGVAFLAALWMVIERGRRRFIWVLAIAAFGLLLSGTRSAILAVVLIVVMWLLVRSSASRPLIVCVGLLGGAALLLLSDVGALFGLQGFTDSTSYEHRTQILGSITDVLTKQDPLAVIFGNGDNARDLLVNGTITTTTGVTVFDNQLVRELAASGVIGTTLLIAGMVMALRRGNGLSRMVVVFVGLMFLSFDALTWQSVSVLFLIACASPLAVKPNLDAATATSHMPRPRAARGARLKPSP
ncbi:hypothetical protein ACVWW9_001662 [Agrococcus sp. UYP33]